ncbi:hypothetical protein ACNQ2O_03095 [Mycoplasma sp. AA7A]|uniref:hypothetical protein n=1 Tax=unclassified Mycoplasma TaxID=2683645 RepID=UPI003AAE2912
MPTTAKRTEISENHSVICNIKKYNEGYEIILKCLKRRVKIRAICEPIFRIIYAIAQCLAFTYAVKGGFITFLNVFCWMGFMLLPINTWNLYLLYKDITHDIISNQVLIEGKNQIEEFSFKNVKSQYDKLSFNIKIYEPWYIDPKDKKSRLQRLQFSVRFWRNLGANNEEIEKIFYFLFSFNYDLDYFFIPKVDSLGQIQYVYYNLQHINYDNKFEIDK